MAFSLALPSQFCVFQVIFAVLFVCGPARSDTLPRGVSSAKGSFYKAGSPFTCLDGSSTIPFDQVNDDYCDCSDGSDEPGTSACPNGKFYCVNKGYKPEIIPSSRVSDSVCDCCDGSDEYEGKGNCQNTCDELGKAMKEELLAMQKLVEEGYRIRTEYSNQGKQAKEEKQQLLVSLGPKREELQNLREELEVKKVAAEEPENAAKEVHENWWKEEKEKRETERDMERALEAFKLLDVNQDGLVSVEESRARAEFDKDSDGTVSQDEVNEYMSSLEPVDEHTFVSTVWPNVKEVISVPAANQGEPLQAPPTGEDDSQIRAPTVDDDDDDDSDFDEDDFDDEDDEDELPDSRQSGSPTAVSDNEMPPYPAATLELIQVADAAREEYNQVNREYNDVNSQIQDIESFLAQDMGPGDVFYPLRDQCYEYTDREYTYKFCPFSKASQRPKGGGSETSLGAFTKWEASGDDEYGIMKFEKGLNCWNGPDRSARVKFTCGKENALTSVMEPNRCEYAFDFTTPAACHTPPEAHVDHDEL